VHSIWETGGLQLNGDSLLVLSRKVVLSRKLVLCKSCCGSGEGGGGGSYWRVVFDGLKHHMRLRRQAA